MTNGMTDWHSHILFGVDDGVETLDDSLEILDAYAAMGFSRVWLTPHIMEDVPNTPTDCADGSPNSKMPIPAQSSCGLRQRT